MIDSSNTESKIGASWLANFLKNSLGNPSGPGDFPFCMDLIEFVSSSIENGFSRSAAVSSLIVGTSNFPKNVSNKVSFSRDSVVYNFE